MKTYSKLLNHSAKVFAFFLMLWSTTAMASINSVVNPVSSEETSKPILSAPPSNLQIVSLSPFVYNGNVNIRCFGQSNGRATVQVVGGTPPYTYQWSGLPYQTGATAYGMSAGTYTVTVTDAQGFLVTGSVTLIQNPPLQGMTTVTPALCNGGVGSVVISATGGTEPYAGLYSYEAVAGTYNYTVADANGCRNQVSATVIEPPVFVATSVATPILCNGDLSEVLVEGFGGTAPYYGTGYHSEFAGTSSYILTDANGCFAYTSVNIDQPPVLSVHVTHTPIACRGGISHVTVSGVGGTTPYSGVEFYNQYAGTYQYTIVDVNGCQSTSPSIVITQPAALVASITATPIACQGGLSSVQVTGSGGTTPYNGTGTFSEPGGLHTYNVTDANGCSVDISTIVIEPREIVLDISWAPIQEGAVTTNVQVLAGGGTPSYYGTGVFVMQEGAHTISVTDNSGCSVTELITIAPPGQYFSSLAQTQQSQHESMKVGNDDDSEKTLVRASYNTSSEEMEFAYRLTYDSKVRFEIYDMTGALVETIQEDMAMEGENYTVSIAPGKLTSGVYIYQFVTDTERQMDKLQVMR